MARVYTVTMAATSVSAAKDLIRISAPSDAVVEILRAEITNEDLETSNQLAMGLYRASTDGTGTSFTATKHEDSDAAFGGTAVVNLSADTTKSPTDPLYRTGFNIGAGALWHPVPEERIVLPPSGRFVVRLDAAPAAATVISAVCVFRELG